MIVKMGSSKLALKLSISSVPPEKRANPPTLLHDISVRLHPGILLRCRARCDLECTAGSLCGRINTLLSNSEMSQQQAAQLLSRVLGGIARYSVVTGIGVAGLQASLYTGKTLMITCTSRSPTFV